MRGTRVCCEYGVSKDRHLRITHADTRRYDGLRSRPTPSPDSTRHLSTCCAATLSARQALQHALRGLVVGIELECSEDVIPREVVTLQLERRLGPVDVEVANFRIALDGARELYGGVSGGSVVEELRAAFVVDEGDARLDRLLRLSIAHEEFGRALEIGERRFHVAHRAVAVAPVEEELSDGLVERDGAVEPSDGVGILFLRGELHAQVVEREHEQPLALGVLAATLPDSRLQVSRRLEQLAILPAGGAAAHVEIGVVGSE